MATHLTTGEMKTFVRQHFEDLVYNKRADVIHRNMTTDFRDHDGPGGTLAGVQEDEAMMQGMYEQMPGIMVTIEEMIAEGDRVVCRNVWRWADAASGKPMEFRGFVEWRFEGDRIAERWAAVTPQRAVSD